MPWLPKNQFLDWPENEVDLGIARIRQLYEAGYAGAKHDPEAVARFLAQQQFPDGDAAAHQFGLAGTGAGKLVIPFVFVVETFPGCWPGPAQDRGDCHVAGTMILGETTKPIEDVEIGDKIWNGEGRLTRVISTRKIETHRPLVQIRPVGGLPLTCTADHKMLVCRKVKARAVAGENSDGLDEPTWVTAGELEKADCLLTPIRFDVLPNPDSPNGLLNTLEGRFILGYFLGNGHASGHSAEWWTPSTEIADRLEKKLSELGWHVQPRTFQRGAYRVRVSSTELAQWLRSQFYRGKTKNFPGWAIGDEAVLSGLTTADGFVGGTARTFDSTSLSLIYGVYASLVKIGFDPTIGTLSRSKGTYANAKPLYRLIWRENKQKRYVWRNENFVCRPIRSLEFLEGIHEVYDIGVEDDHHSFLANGMATHNCVSHGCKNACLTTMACDIVSGQPDEKTGKPEEVPEISSIGIQNGVLSTEAFYWWRGYDGDGWSCPDAANVATKISGCFLRKDYPELGVDLSIYSGKNAGKYGSRKPPDNIKEMGGRHLVHQSTELSSIEAVRDFLFNGYGVFDCGGEGFSSKRDANGVSEREGNWAHSMDRIGVDDRDVVKKLYGGPLSLELNSWSIWNSGPRDIIESAQFVPPEKRDRWIEIGLVNPQTGNIMIPEGSFWALEKEVRRRECFGFSGVNGWPRKNLPDYGTGGAWG